MKFLDTIFKFAIIVALTALMLVLWSCHLDTEEDSFLNVKTDSTWSSFDRVAVVLADSSGSPLDTLFKGRLESAEQLAKLKSDAFSGGKIQIILIGYIGDTMAKREVRRFDSKTRTSGAKTITLPLLLDNPIADPDILDTAIFDIQPNFEKLYTGGPSLTLTPAGSGWTGKPIEWLTSEAGVAMVSDGTVKAVAPGKAWIKAIFGTKRDSTDITVVTDIPVLDPGFDTVVALNASVSFQVKVKQEFGVIAMFKWSLDGDTLWDDSTVNIPADASFLLAPAKVFTAADTFPVRFFVRDGEGNPVSAMRLVAITAEPIAKLGPPEILSLLPSDTTLSIKDSLTFIGKATSHAPMKIFSWDLDGDGAADFSGTLSDTSVTLNQGKRFSVAGTFPVTLKIADNLGVTVTKTVTITVEKDEPQVEAGTDTSVVAGTRYNLHGKSQDKLGRIVKTEWKIGSDAFFLAPNPDTNFTAPSGGATSLICIFRATDDDDQVVEDTVEITVTAFISSDANLSALVVNPGTLIPAFDTSVTAYTLVSPDIISTLTVTPSCVSPKATIKVNGLAVPSGQPSGPLSFANGAKTVFLVVTAEDGQTKTFTITLNQALVNHPDLVFTSVTLTSKTATRVSYNYTIRNNGTVTIPSLLNVAISNYYSANSIFNDALDVPAGSATLGIAEPLAPGQTYSGTFFATGAVPAGMLYVTMKVDGNDFIKESNEVNNFVTRLLTRQPIAQAGKDTTVAAETKVNLHGKASDFLGTVTMMEWKIGSGPYFVSPPDTHFIAPPAAGSTVVCLFRVTDDEGMVAEDTLNVTVSPPLDANLVSLVSSVGSLVPIFSKDITSYTLSVANTVPSITLTPTTAHAGLTVKVNAVTVASGSASAPLSLVVGPNTILVEVKAPSGAKKLYTVTVNKAGSSVNTLAILTASAGPQLTPIFTPTTQVYSMNTSATTTTITATVTPGSGATIKINGIPVTSGSASPPIALPAGLTTNIKVTVTAENGVFRTYSIAFTVPGQGLPDIVVTSAAIVSVTSTQINYVYIIKNQGGANIPNLSGVKIQNYYSVNTVYNDAGDKAAGGWTLGITRSLGIGESLTLTTSTSGAVPTGMKFITFKLDVGESISESNEANNTFALPITP